MLVLRTRSGREMTDYLWLFSIFCMTHITSVYSQKLNPNEKAPNFTLPTLNGPIVYKGVGHKDTNVHPPMIFHEFTNHSGFLECLWTKDSSILELIDNSPDNVKYIFMTSSNDATATAEWMKKRFEDALEKYYSLAKNLSTSVSRSVILNEKNIDEPAQRRSFDLKSVEHNIRNGRIHAYFPMPHRRIDRRSLNNTYSDLPKIRKPGLLKHSNIGSHLTKAWDWKTYSKKHDINFHDNADNHHLKYNHGEEHFRFDHVVSQKRSIIARLRSEISEDADEMSGDNDQSALQDRVDGIMKKGKYKFISDWLDRLHFVTIPLYEVGNWLPLVMSRWYCSGHGCGLDQIAVESQEEGDVYFVNKRLDGRYDWLPSPYTLKAKYPRTKIADYGDGCSDLPGNFSTQLLLISREGNCSFFQKMKSAQKASAIGAILYSSTTEPLVDMTCEGTECEEEMKTPGTMMSYESGKKILKLLALSNDVYIRFQHTPSRNFFVAIDEQGKLQEVGWLLYPSMIFLSYQAKWLNYKTNLLHNISSMNAKVVNVFNATLMQGNKGVVRTIKLPPLSELQRYNHAYIDMALGCPGSTDYGCPHWDHTVQLYVCCDKGNELCGKEIGRWITPFRRRIGRWLTNIRPLIPMFTSTKCTFTMKTVPWAMTWKPALSLRFADKIMTNISSPFQVIPLFRGGKFDKTYNTKPKRSMNFTIPQETTKVQFFATITGHGSDNNNCAEFCITSHHFVINNKHKNTRIFDTAGTATGCADKVTEGSEPNEHGTWLYGRDGWCDGQNVSPWVEDVTQQVNIGEINSIRYYGFFNNTDPNPTANPGNIIMYSYLVFYKDV